MRYGNSGLGFGRVAPDPNAEVCVAETEVAVGTPAPIFAAPDENGQLCHLSEALERSAQVLIFYRGDW